MNKIFIILLINCLIYISCENKNEPLDEQLSENAINNIDKIYDQIYAREEYLIFTDIASRPGLFYFGNGIFYLKKPNYPVFEIARIYVDYYFNITDIKISEVKIINDELYVIFDDEIINYIEDIEKVIREKYIDYYGHQFRIITINEFPKIGESLAKEIYFEDVNELAIEGNDREVYNLLETLRQSRIVIFNTNYESQRYIFKDMELIRDVGWYSHAEGWILPH